MPEQILVILGHPVLLRESFCEALAKTYVHAANMAGHDACLVKLSDLNFDPILHDGYDSPQKVEQSLRDVRDKINAADHIVFIYPLWQFMIPALLKGFMEREFAPGFAYEKKPKNPLAAGLMKGKTARIIQTMGMPAFIHNTFFRAHGAKALKNILEFCGISPVHMTYCGSIESETARQKYLKEIEHLGTAGA